MFLYFRWYLSWYRLVSAANFHRCDVIVHSPSIASFESRWFLREASVAKIANHSCSRCPFTSLTGWQLVFGKGGTNFRVKTEIENFSDAIKLVFVRYLILSLSLFSPPFFFPLYPSFGSRLKLWSLFYTEVGLSFVCAVFFCLKPTVTSQLT